MPSQLRRAVQLVPVDHLGWRPGSWGGAPGETFSAIEHVCHLRDIEQDGYQVRIRRMLEESNPSLLSLDGYEMARQRGYQSAGLEEALSGFGEARAATLARLQRLSWRGPGSSRSTGGSPCAA